ncbi:MAG: YaiO family outer membrane beta-barrel protein [Bacteroidales bacterium]|nr:YaiO family outer membrane beta-barrel protein [Bacteroidales bacterium]
MCRIIYLLVILFMPVLLPCSLAQEGIADPEAAYDSIRTVAFQGQLEDAEAMARALVDEYPSYGDAIVLLSRIIAWQERYDEAIDILDSLLVVQPGHNDAIQARNTISEWLPDTISRDLDIYMGYSFDIFSQPYNRFWQIFRMGAAFETAPGPVLGTFNFGNLHAGTDPAIAETGIQLQAEFRPQITDNSYAWLAYSYSPFTYFPQHRASAEYWYGFNKGWVLSGGASYFYFDRNILIPALSLEKYLHRYWFSAKLHFHLKEAGTTSSLFLTARRYSNDTDYIQLKAGAGTAPDEPWDLAADLDRQEAYSFSLGMKKKLNDNFSVSCNAGYSREQYNNDLWRNRFETFISVIYSPVVK